MKMENAMKNLVTVVIPVYGVEKYLDRCVSSVVGQTYSNLEIILIDDGSKDNCPQMCDAWAEKDSRIRVIHKANAGLGMARNTGIEHATGEYICFFDSDDYIHNDTIEKALGLALDQKAQIVVFGSCDVDADGKIIATFVPAPEVTCVYGKDVQDHFLPDLIDPRHRDANYPDLMLSACCCLYDMKLIRQTQFRFVSERQNISEDSYSLIWLYRYVECVALLPEAKYYYCKNTASLTQSYRPDRFERVNAFYRDTMKMAKAQGYSDAVLVRIKGLYLSFIIAAIKQTAAARVPWRKKRKNILELLHDPQLRQVLQDPACRYRSRTRQVMLAAMRSGWAAPVMLLAMLQNRKQK